MHTGSSTPMSDPDTPFMQSNPGLVGGVTLGALANHIHVVLGVAVLLYTLHSAYLRNRRERLLLKSTAEALERCRCCPHRLTDKPEEP